MVRSSKKSGALSQNIELVALKFSFRDFEQIPKGLRRKSNESREQSYARNGGRTLDGVQIVDGVTQCDVEKVVEDLLADGFVLVDAFWQERIHATDPRERRTYAMLRYQFGRAKTAELHPEFVKETPQLMRGLKELCAKSFWRVRAHLNPLFNKGQEVKGKKSVDVGLEVRVPRFRPDGALVTQRDKDANGRPVGDPKPLMPNATLRVVGDKIALV